MISVKTIDSLLATIFSKTVSENLNEEKKRLAIEKIDLLLYKIQVLIESDPDNKDQWSDILTKLYLKRAEFAQNEQKSISS